MILLHLMLYCTCTVPELLHCTLLDSFDSTCTVPEIIYSTCIVSTLSYRTLLENLAECIQFLDFSTVEAFKSLTVMVQCLKAELLYIT